MAHPSIHPYSIQSARTAGRIDRLMERERRYTCRQAVIAAWLRATDDELQAMERDDEQWPADLAEHTAE